MPHVLLATLGQRPETITIALDLLPDRYPIETVVVVHTEPNVSGIHAAIKTLQGVMTSNYS